MSEDSDLEKTEPPSSRKLEKAREEGDVPRSRELSMVVLLVVAGSALWVMGDTMFARLSQILKNSLKFNRDQAFDMTEISRVATQNIIEAILAFAPLGLVVVVAIVGSPLIIGGWNFSSKALMPNFGKLNVVKGLGNIVSKNSGVELIKSLLKTFFVGIIAWVVVKGKFGEFTRLSDMPIEVGVSKLGSIMWVTYITIVSALVLIAIIDVAYQLWHYNDKLKMTKQEVRDEAKESEGNPEVKAKIRFIQREMARRRMMADIPTADVVITNPTHYAVALKYSENSSGAPKVVAKGADAVAAKIREIASQNKVPLMEAPPLARALHEHAEIGDEIPEALFSAVAEVLAYIFQLKKYTQSGGIEPVPPTDITVPSELDPLNDTSKGERQE